MKLVAGRAQRGPLLAASRSVQAGPRARRIGPPVEATGREQRGLNAEVQRWMESTMQELRGP